MGGVYDGQLQPMAAQAGFFILYPLFVAHAAPQYLPMHLLSEIGLMGGMWVIIDHLEVK